MIRPLTIASFLLACGSGLYLYQSKHEVQLLDRTIERTVHERNTLREQSRLLATEWTMLNDLQRLRQFSDAYLNLRNIAPSQFTSLADLNTRLPAPQIAPPQHDDDDRLPVPVTIDPATQPIAAIGVEPVPAIQAPEPLPIPPVPVPAPPPPAAAARIVEHKPVAPRLPVVAEARPAEQHTTRPPEQRPVEARVPDMRVADMRPVMAASTPRPVAPPQPRPVASVPAPAPTPVPMPTRPAMVAAAPAPYGGSLLGMARASVPPPAPPMPVSTSPMAQRQLSW